MTSPCVEPGLPISDGAGSGGVARESWSGGGRVGERRAREQHARGERRRETADAWRGGALDAGGPGQGRGGQRGAEGQADGEGGEGDALEAVLVLRLRRLGADARGDAQASGAVDVEHLGAEAR